MTDIIEGEPADDSDDPVDPPTRTVRVRRSPKVGVFLVIGLIVGVLAAVVLVAVTPPDSQYPTAQVFGFTALLTAPIGAALGGLVAVVLDRVSVRRSRLVSAERVSGVDEQDDDPMLPSVDALRPADDEPESASSAGEPRASTAGAVDAHPTEPPGAQSDGR